MSSVNFSPPSFSVRRNLFPTPPTLGPTGVATGPGLPAFGPVPSASRPAWLAFGLVRLASGLARLAFGLARLAFGLARLASGLVRLAFGPAWLAFGPAWLAFGPAWLALGLGPLKMRNLRRKWRPLSLFDLFSRADGRWGAASPRKSRCGPSRRVGKPPQTGRKDGGALPRRRYARLATRCGGGYVRNRAPARSGAACASPQAGRGHTFSA